MSTSIPVREQLFNAATLTATTSSAVIANPGSQVNSDAVAYLRVAGPVTGTSPSMTVTLYGSSDGVNFASLGAFAAQTAATAAGAAVRLALTGVVDPFIMATAAITGTTPSFGGVSLDAYFANPESA